MDDIDKPQPANGVGPSERAGSFGRQEDSGSKAGARWSEFQRDYRSVAGSFRSWIRRLDRRFGF
jgi:hypothetical protein